MHDVEPRQYATVIREMIRHENDVTNHRIMWLLIAQGLIANAYVSAARSTNPTVVLSLVGILVTLSAFIILYKSYQARGYLHFLGNKARLGLLEPAYLPLDGWPTPRIKGWRPNVWVNNWIGHASDVLEPYIFLPVLITVAWMFALLRHFLSLNTAVVLVLTLMSVGVLFAALCWSWVRWQMKDEEDVRHEDLSRPMSYVQDTSIRQQIG